MKQQIEEKQNNTLRHFGRRSIKHANTTNLLIFIDKQYFSYVKTNDPKSKRKVTCSKAYPKSVVEEITIRNSRFR